MHQPSSRHLTHDYEAYKGLSLRELFWIVVVATPMTSLVFAFGGIFAGFPFALGCIGFVVGFIFSITVFPKRIARLKAGKPHGFLMKQMYVYLAHFHIKRSPYLTHLGFWQTSKLLKVPHV